MVHVILVDEADNVIGTMEKIEAHKKGLLHRAISVVVFNAQRQILLQKRAFDKYHSGGLWTNTCCSHPLPGETIADAAARTLYFEMGIKLQPTFAYSFLYNIGLGNDLTEHELDHVFIASFDDAPTVNKDEVADWKWMDIKSLENDIAEDPHNYSAWFKLMIGHTQLSELAERTATIK